MLFVLCRALFSTHNQHRPSFLVAVQFTTEKAILEAFLVAERTLYYTEDVMSWCCSSSLLNVLLLTEGRFISVIKLMPQIEFTELYFGCFFFFSFDPFIKISLNPPTASTQPLLHAWTHMHTHTLAKGYFHFMLCLYCSLGLWCWS